MTKAVVSSEHRNKPEEEALVFPSLPPSGESFKKKHEHQHDTSLADWIISGFPTVSEEKFSKKAWPSRTSLRSRKDGGQTYGTFTP